MMVDEYKKDECALSDESNWPCQWSIKIVCVDETIHHCPKVCDHFHRKGE